MQFFVMINLRGEGIAPLYEAGPDGVRQLALFTAQIDADRAASNDPNAVMHGYSVYNTMDPWAVVEGMQ